MLSYCKVIKQYVVLGTKSQAASDQSHVLTDVVPVDVGSATGGREQAWHMKAGGLITNYLAGMLNVCVCVFIACLQVCLGSHLLAWTVLWSSQHRCVLAGLWSVLRTCSLWGLVRPVVSCCPLWIPVKTFVCVTWAKMERTKSNLFVHLPFSSNTEY